MSSPMILALARPSWRAFYIRELLMRADAKRVLIVAPGSLVEQWQDEMFEKFGLTFVPFSARSD
jgi:SNF2 family DNA or RNA helicase